MTKRQQRIRDYVIANRDQIIEMTKHEMQRYHGGIGGIGFTVCIRLMMDWRTNLAVAVTQTGDDDYVWREASWYRGKGFSEPSWKPLI